MKFTAIVALAAVSAQPSNSTEGGPPGGCPPCGEPGEGGMGPPPSNGTVAATPYHLVFQSPDGDMSGECPPCEEGAMRLYAVGVAALAAVMMNL